MSVPTVDFIEVSAKLENAPSLEPRPNATNIAALDEYIVDVICAFPSHQSADFGFQGLFQNAAIYALVCNVPWVNFPDQGTTRRGTEANPHPDFPTHELDHATVKMEEAMWTAGTKSFMSEANVRRAVNDTLNRCVPKSYRRVPGGNIGSVNYKVTDSPRDIMDRLRHLYGKPSPDEKRANETRFGAPWDTHADTVEDLFSRLEQCYTTAVLARPPFTMEQLIDKAVMAIQATGLYPTALMEWNGFDEVNKTWPELKSHFTKAYDILLTSGAGTAAQNGYHGMNNATEGDDDSIGSIKSSLQTIHLANNANAQAMNENISAITEEARQLRAILATIQQQVAMLAQARPGGNPYPMVPSAYVPPPAVPYWNPQYAQQQPAPPPAAYNMQPPPPTYIQAPAYQRDTAGGGRGGRGGRRGKKGRGGGRGGRGGAYAPVPPPLGGYIPPPPGQTSQQGAKEPYSNTTKHFNNWNMCVSCGWDVPSWHTSKTCDNRYPQHNEAVDRSNAEQYAAAGWKVSKKNKHKVQLPINPRPEQA